MSEEEKDFVVKDSRSLDEDGNPRDNTPEEEPEKKPEDKKQTAGTPPLPEADFTTLIFSLSSTALFHIGDIADPETGKKTVDLSLAKHAIDTISMLQEKTSGNLSGEEKKFTESVLADLRWRFVNAGK
jgi:hypothetical protein